MTGRYACNVGMSTVLVPGNPAGLSPEYTILPEQLNEIGYKNYLVGKWHLGHSKLMYHPLNRGFHEFYGLNGVGFDHFSKQEGKGRYDFWKGFEPVMENKTHSTELLGAEAIKIVKSHMEEDLSNPFFLYLAFPAVHDPLQAPEKHQQLCSHIKNKRRRLTCAMVMGVDESIGDIIQVLEEHGKLEETIIVFSSDNGGVPYAGSLNYPLRGGKSTLYEGGVRSPGFIHAPNILNKKSYDFKDLFHVSDFFPTLISMIHNNEQANSSILHHKELDGIDQFLALKQSIPSPRKNVHIHRDWNTDGHAYRRGPWKIIIGQHFIPFFFKDVYNETSSSWWLVDNGNWLDKLLHIFQEATDSLLGAENTMFAEYALWIIIGGINMGASNRVNELRKHNLNTILSKVA